MSVPLRRPVYELRRYVEVRSRMKRQLTQVSLPNALCHFGDKDWNGRGRRWGERALYLTHCKPSVLSHNDSALRWAQIHLCFPGPLVVEGNGAGHNHVSIDPSSWWKVNLSRGSNQHPTLPSAYKPRALPLGQSDSLGRCSHRPHLL